MEATGTALCSLPLDASKSSLLGMCLYSLLLLFLRVYDLFPQNRNAKRFHMILIYLFSSYGITTNQNNDTAVVSKSDSQWTPH